jgi:hypothetical protein
MFSTTLPLGANDQANESVSRKWSHPPALTTSEFEQNLFEEQLFSPTSPASAELHRNRIEELLLSPTSPVNAALDRNREPSFSPPTPANVIMAPRNRGLQIPQPLPRSFDELHTERAYLLDCLQIENCKATELLRSIPSLEARLIGNNESFLQQRKIKKRLGWLRHRLVETIRQEKRILARLGKVTFEIQTRERWTQIEYEHRQREIKRHQNYCNGLYGMQQTRLNPESLAFQPPGYQMPNIQWHPETWQQWQSRDGQEGWEGNYGPVAGKSSSNSSNLAAQCSPSDEVAPDDITTTLGHSPNQNEFRRCSLIHRSSSLNDTAEQLGVFSTSTIVASVPRVKRLSLPSLSVLLTPSPNIWAPTPDEKDIQDICKDRDQV